MGRLAKPEEIGQAVLFLASDYAAYITGTTLPGERPRLTTPWSIIRAALKI